jgi:hypothetical protein
LAEAKRLFDDSNGGLTLADAIDRILDVGLLVNSCNICCPDCDEEYILGTTETYLKWYEAVGGPVVPPAISNVAAEGQCCRNIFSSIEKYLLFLEATDPDTYIDYTPCCNGFTECLNDMIKYFSEKDCYFLERGIGYNSYDLISYLLDAAIIEQNTINGSSQLCTIFNILKEYTDCGCFSFALIRILDKGVVIKCEDNGNMIISSMETYLKYVEAIASAPAAFNKN